VNSPNHFVAPGVRVRENGVVGGIDLGISFAAHETNSLTKIRFVIVADDPSFTLR
jgi:hypothetical protein